MSLFCASFLLSVSFFFFFFFPRIRCRIYVLYNIIVLRFLLYLFLCLSINLQQRFLPWSPDGWKISVGPLLFGAFFVDDLVLITWF